MNGQEPNPGGTDIRQALSALMDGDADDGAVARACAAWRGETQARADWHAYHVIGDVLRTADQCPSSRGDAAFVEGVRRRLELEPVVVAPSVLAEAHEAPSAVSSAAAAPRRGAWRTSLAAAAGVAAVAGVVFIVRPGLPEAQAPTLARADPPPQVAVQPVAAAQAHAAVQPTTVAGSGQAAPVIVVRDPRMLRDERLDRYLDAHRQFSESAWTVAPAATVRGVSALAPER